MSMDPRKQLTHARTMAERCHRMAEEEPRPEVSDYLRDLADSFEIEAERLAARAALIGDSRRTRRPSV